MIVAMQRKLAIMAVALAAAPVVAQDEEVRQVFIDDVAQVRIETSLGNIVVELNAERAPMTVESFLQYVVDDYYDGTIFHRVAAGFIVQGGGYLADLTEKPAERTVFNESGNGLSNLRAYLAMARTSDPHTANSQFYINLADNTALDPRPTRWGYTVFGRVVDGMNVIDDIGYRATGPGPIPQLARDVPAEPIVIKKMIRLDDSTAAPTAPENVTIE